MAGEVSVLTKKRPGHHIVRLCYSGQLRRELREQQGMMLRRELGEQGGLVVTVPSCEDDLNGTRIEGKGEDRVCFRSDH